MRQTSFCWGVGEGDPGKYSMPFLNIKQATAAPFVVLVRKQATPLSPPSPKKPLKLLPLSPPSKMPPFKLLPVVSSFVTWRCERLLWLQEYCTRLQVLCVVVSVLPLLWLWQCACKHIVCVCGLCVLRSPCSVSSSFFVSN